MSSLEVKIVLNFGSFFIVFSISISEMLNMRSLTALEEFYEKTLFSVIKSNETFYEEVSECFSFEVHILAGDIII